MTVSGTTGTTALLGGDGYQCDVAESYMDVAIPVQRGGETYIIYIVDNKATADDLTGEMFVLIAEALVVALVISVLLSFLLSKTMVTPLQKLTDGAKRGETVGAFVCLLCIGNLFFDRIGEQYSVSASTVTQIQFNNP